jgi:hypothetical protein
VASLITRKRTFLEDPIWHTVPYMLVPKSKTPQSYLLDCLTSVPGLLEDHEKLETLLCCPDQPNAIAGGELRSTMINRLTSLLEYLFLWRCHWQAAFGSDVSAKLADDGRRSNQCVYNSKSLDDLERFYKLQFTNPRAAADVALYNAVLMWLLALIHDLDVQAAEFTIQNCARSALRSFLADQPVDFVFQSRTPTQSENLLSFDPLNSPGQTTYVREAAIEICRIFEWQSQNHSTSRETNFVYMFPVGLALCVLDVEPENRDWVRAMLDADTFTRDYGADNLTSAVPSNSSHGDDLSGNMSVDTQLAGGPGIESGVLHRLQDFAWYVTRELADGSMDQSSGHDETSTERRNHFTREIFNPGLVHLLLLRGRMEVSL